MRTTTGQVSDSDQPSRILSPDEDVFPSESEMFAEVHKKATHPYKFTPNGDVTIDEDTILIDADPLDTLLDAGKHPLENFITELETRLIRGEMSTSMKLRIWAKRQYGVDNAQLQRYTSVIRGSWRLEGTSVFVADQRRNELRQYYMEIYRETMNEGDSKNLALALKTIDAMAKLDGLAMPDVTVNVTAANQMPQSEQELTNKVRERTQLLLQTMRERAEKHASMTTRAIVEKRAEKKQDEMLESPSSMVMGSVK